MQELFARNLLAATRCVEAGPRPGTAGRVLDLLRSTVGADAVSLLTGEGPRLSVRAAAGLRPRARGRRLEIDAHPRLRKLDEADAPFVFAPDDPRPDPWDGFLLVDPEARVHACAGASLRGIDGRRCGLLTLDAAEARRFGPQVLGPIASFAALLGLVLDADADAAPASRAAGRRELLGQSPVMAALREEIALVAPSDLPVFIEGETGVGKELVAEAVHASSRRAGAPLIRINCAALPESLAESELFGHRRGAFTGASSDHRGAFARADGGTLLLDEFGELPPRLQAKLLRVLQNGELAVLGEERPRRVDVRVIAASNRDLRAAVEAGQFREDLWYRVAAFPLRVPPLRARGRDLLLLAEHFLAEAGAPLGLGAASLSPAAERALLDHPWPGNVRELQNRIVRASLRAAARSPCGEARIEPADLELSSDTGQGGVWPTTELQHPEGPWIHSRTLRSAGPGQSRADDALPEAGLAGAVDELRRELIERAVALSGGNWAEAARRLRLDRSNLHRMARRLGLK